MAGYKLGEAVESDPFTQPAAGKKYKLGAALEQDPFAQQPTGFAGFLKGVSDDVVGGVAGAAGQVAQGAQQMMEHDRSGTFGATLGNMARPAQGIANMALGIGGLAPPTIGINAANSAVGRGAEAVANAVAPGQSFVSGPGIRDALGSAEWAVRPAGGPRGAIPKPMNGEIIPPDKQLPAPAASAPQIEGAAVRTTTGEVVPAKSHAQARSKVKGAGMLPNEEGFVDQNGQFLTRTQAQPIAEASGQLSPGKANDPKIGLESSQIREGGEIKQPAAAAAPPQLAAPVEPATPPRPPEHDLIQEATPQAVGAERTEGLQRPPKRADINETDWEIERLRGRELERQVRFANEIQSRPPELAAAAERLQFAREGDPNVVLTPEEHALNERFINPIYEDIERNYEVKLDLSKKLSEELADEIRAEKEGLYTTRHEAQHLYERMGLGKKEARSPEVMGSRGSGTYTASAEKARKYFVVENAAGERRVVEISPGARANGRGNIKGVDGMSYRPEQQGTSVSRGSPVRDRAGNTWMVNEARTLELEHAGVANYLHDGHMGALITRNDLERSVDELRTALRMRDEMQSKGWVVPPGSKLTPAQTKLGYRETSFPGYQNYKVHPRVARALDRLRPEKGDSVMQAMVAASRAITKTMFINPIPHTLNTAWQWAYHKNVGLFTPGTVGRLQAAARDVTTNSQLYMDVLKEGSRLWTATKASAQGHEAVQAAVKHVIQQPEMKGVAHALGMKVSDVFERIYANSHDAVAVIQDTFIMERVRANMEKGMNVREAVHDAFEVLVNYTLPTEMNLPTEKMGAWATKGLESPLGTLAFNFARWDFGLTNSSVGSAYRAVKYAREGIERAMSTKDAVAGRTAMQSFNKARENLFRVIAIGIGTYVIMPWASQKYRELSGNDKAKLQDHGASSTARAISNVITGNGTLYDGMRIAGVSPSPITSMFVDTMSVGTKRWRPEISRAMGAGAIGPDTVGTWAERMLDDVPLYSTVAKPGVDAYLNSGKSPSPVLDFFISQTLGLGHRRKGEN